jgi:hypothetical protein
MYSKICQTQILLLCCVIVGRISVLVFSLYVLSINETRAYTHIPARKTA